MSRRARTLIVVAVCGAVGIAPLVACTNTTVMPPQTSAVAPSPSTTLLDVGGSRAGVATTEDGTPADALFEGTIAVDDRGCWVLIDDEGPHFPVRWPYGTTAADGGLVLPGGVSVTDGSRVALGGGAEFDVDPGSEDVGCWTRAEEVIEAATAELTG